MLLFVFFFFFQAEDGIRYLVRSRGLGDVYKRQDEYYAIGEKVVGRINSLMADGNSIEDTVKKLQRETKLSEDLIRYILKEQVMA